MEAASHIYQNIDVGGNARVAFGNPYSIENLNLKILKWLSPLDPWPKHKEARDQYREGTQDWFFSHPTFHRWLSGDVQVLWCLGPMGTGKTVLMSAVLEHLQQSHSAERDTAAAFLHFL